jgi:hypothetical protein
MTKKRGDLGNAAKDLVEDISDYFSNDNPDNTAGRDITQDYSRSSTDIRSYSNEGDVVEGDQSNIVISASECEPDSISVKTVDAPFGPMMLRLLILSARMTPNLNQKQIKPLNLSKTWNQVLNQVRRSLMKWIICIYQILRLPQI